MSQTLLELPLAFTPSFVLDGRCVEFPEGLKTASYGHTLHRFPGKFVPQVARELLALVGAHQGTTIMDPFCGSGTSLIEASLLGIPSIGVDFDSLAAFVTTAKITPLSAPKLKRLRQYWAGIDLTTRFGPLPPVPNFLHWFTSDAADQLAGIKNAALSIDDPQLRHFSLAVMSSIVRRVSNADDQTQKTYVSGTLKKTPPLPFDLFPVVLAKAIQGIEQYSEACLSVPQVLKADSRALSAAVKADGVITSPPYVDSIDYIYNQMLEYFWLYDVLGIEIDAIPGLRKLPMGFAGQDPSTALALLRGNSPKAAGILAPHVEGIAASSLKEAKNVAGFFLDMLAHVATMKRLLRPGGRYAMVVGESYIRGQQVPTPEIIPHLFEAGGFANLGACSYKIKRHYMKFPRRSNSGKIVLDHVLCFERL